MLNKRHACLGLILLTLSGCSSNPSPVALQQAPPPISRAQPQGVTGTINHGSDNQALAKKAWEVAEQAHTEAAYAQFAKAYPSDTHASAAKEKSERLAWQSAQKSGSIDQFRNYLNNYPNGPHAAAARQHSEVQQVSLEDAIAKRLVKYEISGSGLQYVSLTLTRKGDRPVSVTIPAGTYFVSGGGSSQNMVACEENSADLTRDRTDTVSVRAACANFHLEEPDSRDRFSVKQSHPNLSLRALLAVIASEHPTSIASQLAIWAVTDNPSKDEVAGHIMPSPKKQDYREAAELLTHAHIKARSKQMFQ